MINIIVIQLANGTSTLIIPFTDPLQTGLTVGMFLVTIALAIIAWRSLIASNRSTQASNELTRKSLKLQQAELKWLVGQPEIDVVNYHPEPSGGSHILRLYPNFINNGKIPARSICIFSGIVSASGCKVWSSRPMVPNPFQTEPMFVYQAVLGPSRSTRQ